VSGALGKVDKMDDISGRCVLCRFLQMDVLFCSGVEGVGCVGCGQGRKNNEADGISPP
jgi:hypothetical protein